MKIECLKHGEVEFNGTGDFIGDESPITMYCPECEGIEPMKIEMRMILPPSADGEASVVYTYNAGRLSIPHLGAPSNLDVNDGIANGTIKPASKFISVEEALADIEEALKTS